VPQGEATGSRELPGPTPGRGWWAIPLAAGGALIALLVAPDGWGSGPGTLIVEVEGERVVSEPVEVGSGATVEIDAPGPRGRVEVVVPEGFPTDHPVELTVTRDGPDLSVSDVAVDLVLADGGIEVIPALASSDGVVTAARRPPVDSGVVLALLAAVVILWVSEIVPLFVTSLAIPVVLAVAEVGTASEVLSPFFDPIIVLFFAGFVMAEVMRRVGLERWAAVTIVARAGTGPVRLYVALLGVSAFLSMWMSNTAAVTVLIPVALSVTEPFGHLGYRKAAVLGIAYAATIGGVGSAIGTPANQLAIRFIDDLTGRSISFAEWFGFGLPLAILFLPLMGLYLWRTAGVRLDLDRFVTARAEAIAQRDALGGFTRDQFRVLAVFAVVMALWLTQSWHDLSTGIVALGGAVVLFATGLAEPEDLGRISWPTLLTFGGGLTLGVAMVDSGTADWIVTRLDGLEGASTPVGVLAAAAIALALSTVASNTASAATLIPLAIPLAGMLGVDPVLLVVAVALATSIDFALVVGTPPTMLAYGTGLFSTGEVLRRGLPLDVLGLLLLLLVAVTVWPALGLV
jgi:sodium-dependent dicarboxylate transporter 2/3/5